jgi:plasmid stabilization system protein ParE
MKVEFLTPAQREFEQIVRYYDEQREGLGNQFITEFRRTVRRIENFPTAWFPLSSDVRRCQVHRFPYSVIYTVRNEGILIAAIQHHKRQPDHWRNRLV